MIRCEHIRDVRKVAGSIWRDESNQNQCLRRLFMAAGWQAWKRVVRRPVGMKLFNGIHFRAYPDCGCSSAAFYFRIPNSLHMTFFRSQINGRYSAGCGGKCGTCQHAACGQGSACSFLRAECSIPLCCTALQFTTQSHGEVLEMKSYAHQEWKILRVTRIGQA